MNRSLNKILFSIVVVCCLVGLSFPVTAKDYLYVPSNNNLHIVDCDTDTVVKTIPFNDYIVGAIPSPDGKRFYMNSWHSIYEVDTQTNQIVQKHEFWSDLNRVTIMMGIAVSPDSKYLYMSASITKKKLNIPRLNVLPPQLVVYDVRKKQVAKNFEIPPNCAAVVGPPDDPDSVILLAQDVFKLNLKDGKVTKMLGVLHPEAGKPGLNVLAIWNNWSPGKNGMVSVPSYSAEALFYMLIDKKGNLRMQKAEEMIFAYSSTVSPDSKYIYAAMDEVYKIDLESGKTLAMDPLERGTCYSVALTSDGKKLYVGPGGPDVSVYDTATMKRMGIIPLKGDGLIASLITK
jgi:DNA-binding beta-propeller fold protein YncE